MPPKKKQQQIDISTLPPCTSINAVILCKGKKNRADLILQKIFKEAEKYLGTIKKTELLEHAKQKNIYVDPSTLNEKQKKDPKFMESISTELTPEVIAKSLQSLTSTLNVKIRLEKKNQLEKAPENVAEPNKFDIIYHLADFPQTKQQYEEIAKIGQNLSFILVFNPTISWASAPEIPEEEEEGQEEDEEIKQYKALLKKEEKSNEDMEYEKGVSEKIKNIQKLRSQAQQNSEFRNCTISYIDGPIDPYNQEQSINGMVQQFAQRIQSLYEQLHQFKEWSKDKQTVKINLQENQPESVYPTKTVTNATPMQLLLNLVQNITNSDQSIANNSDQEALNLIQHFSTSKSGKPNSKKEGLQKIERKISFYAETQSIGQNQVEKDIRCGLKCPGINRYLMPDLPAKSNALRNYLRAQVGQFLKEGLSLEQYERRLEIVTCEQYLRQYDEERQYDLSNRVYAEHHGKESLQRQFAKYLEMHEYNLFTKYNEDHDKLYVFLLYKNNARRVSKKNWEGSWKVLPNNQLWLEYFKNNEQNLNNTHYYDIDYEKIGPISQKCRAYTLRSGSNGAVIIQKQCLVSSKQQNILYGVKNDHSFGINSHGFYSLNKSVRVDHQKVGQEADVYESIIRLEDKSVIRVQSNGNVITECNGNVRLITPNGYCVVYGQDQNMILHPNGSISYSDQHYTNPEGLGLKDNALHTVPTLKRTAQQCQITKRDDNTVIIQKPNSDQIIYFGDGTIYLVTSDGIQIEKPNHPFISCCEGSVHIETADHLKITLNKRENGYFHEISYWDGTNITMKGHLISIGHEGEQETIDVDIEKRRMSSKFEEEELVVGEVESKYFRKGKQVDPQEDEDKYGEDETLPADYIHPRLFIINNDNTAKELLNQHMVQGYLNQYLEPKGSKPMASLYQKQIPSGKTQIHLLRNPQSQISSKIILDLDINLDIFQTPSQNHQESQPNTLILRTFIKNSDFDLDSRKQIQLIREQLEQWRKYIQKENNEYGQKPRNDPATNQKYQSSKITIAFRKKQGATFNSALLKQHAISCYEQASSEKQRDLQKIQHERNLRMNHLKKRNTLIQKYRDVQVNKSISNEQNLEAYPEPGFCANYFQIAQGRKALSEMPEWIFRPKEIKQIKESDQEIINQLNETAGKIAQKEEELAEEQRERYDTVEVQINPKQTREIFIKPSVFTQRDIDEERFAFEQEKKAYKYHELKRKEYDLLGRERKNKLEVPSLMRTQPISEINQKYLVTEAPLDRKVKISSMKNKLTSQASGMIEMRKEGPHSILIKTLDKGNDINKLLERRTMMVQADLNDKLQRDILVLICLSKINPVEANFGLLRERKTYELKIEIKNQDILAQRITLKRPKTIHARVQMNEMGPIALGMTRKISVFLRATPEIIGKFSDEFEIVTKHEIYHIPIHAHIIADNQLKGEGFRLSKGVFEVQEGKKKKEEYQLPPINK